MNFGRPTFAVITFPGSNCDRDCEYVLRDVVKIPVRSVWHEETDLSDFDAVVLPGGFSYGDYLRAGAIASVSPIVSAVRAFAAGGGLVLGICNGFQILLEAGLLPGAMLPNHTATFRCEWVHVRVERSDTPFTLNYGEGQVVRMPIAHGEGNYFADPLTLTALEARRGVVFRYVDANGRASEAANPNGALHNIAGVCSAAGNVLGLMPHPERCTEAVLGSEDGRAVFESMVRWLTASGDCAPRPAVAASGTRREKAR
ncbi:MAG: phosphoribosylformylglycinamidine synthase subunit PurQ [Armatimonadota bacterium]|nr:phosphoribosylformylglycinamidine synthase subunit PurQ [Armatimonadota bacterium]MDR5697837.1 phosphoribosylformylglycinamidine synthase subunit PurQ [Armatimonadota bacterium]